MTFNEFRSRWQKRRDDFAKFRAQVDAATLIDRLLADLDGLTADLGETLVTPRAERSESFRDPAKEPLLIVKDAAKYLGLAPQTLAKMRLSGDSPPFYKLGRRVLYKRTELDSWVTARRRRSTSDTGEK
jgi:excisionase family DNA binding protein